MIEKPAAVNHWKRYHESLHPPVARQFKERIQAVLNISQSAYYRKMNNPAQLLSMADKLAIAWVYRVRVDFLFPELAAVAGAMTEYRQVMTGE